MNKNHLPIYLSLAVIFGILLGVLFNGSFNPINVGSTSFKEMKIRRLINYIEKDYLDTVNTDNLLDGAIKQMLGKLDPHSVYIPKENLQAVTENMQGNFVGIGVQFRMIKDSITVLQTIKGGPSMAAGIKAGDRILIANKDTLYGKKIHTNQVPKHLKGKPNTNINIQVYRKSNDSLFTINITRGKVNIKSVDIAYMINNTIGYIKLDRFARNTYKEFKAALQKLQTKGMTSLVLDLRGNPGGFIDIANSIIDEFLEEDKLIVFTKNNKGNIKKYFATKKGSFENGELYILIDENSASASEIVAGALQDNDKGVIIGRRSFGKGLVQQEMDLGDGSAIRLTTARYYTPTGRSIQKPYKKEKKDTYKRESFTRHYSGELTNKDSIKKIDSLHFITPKGKTVYGGGGITPDIFVPIDTTSYMNNYYFTYLRKFSFNYVDSNRNKLTKKWTLSTFLKDFNKNDTIFNLFLDTVKKQKISPKMKFHMRWYLKALIANALFGDEGFYRVNHTKDKMLLKILELETKN